MPKTKRIYRQGNSCVITLSPDDLAYLHADPGDYVEIRQLGLRRLQLRLRAQHRVDLTDPDSYYKPR